MIPCHEILVPIPSFLISIYSLINSEHPQQTFINLLTSIAPGQCPR